MPSIFLIERTLHIFSPYSSWFIIKFPRLASIQGRQHLTKVSPQTDIDLQKSYLPATYTQTNQLQQRPTVQLSFRSHFRPIDIQSPSPHSSRHLRGKRETDWYLPIRNQQPALKVSAHHLGTGLSRFQRHRSSLPTFHSRPLQHWHCQKTLLSLAISRCITPSTGVDNYSRHYITLKSFCENSFKPAAILAASPHLNSYKRASYKKTAHDRSHAPPRG